MTFVRSRESRQKQLLAYFRRFTDPETCQMVFNEIKGRHKDDGILCPHCQSHRVVRYGKYKDRQRYKCKACFRTFNDFTCTPLSGTHYPEKWIKFLEFMLLGYSLRVAAARVEGVSYVTLFYWRHKIIRVLDLLDDEVTDEMRDQLPRWWHNLIIQEQPARNKGKYIWVRYKKYFPHVLPWELERFKPWISSFEKIARTYWTRYVAWFRFFKQYPLHQELEAMIKLLKASCSVPLHQTYKSIRINII